MPEGPVATIIRRKLTEAFNPERLEIEDDSGRHSGHHHEGGIDGQPGGESHFNLTIIASAFTGLGRLARQRAIHEVLRDELAGPVHALAIRATGTGEASGGV